MSAMAMDIDKGLDELITNRRAANKNTKRGGGAGGRRGAAASAAGGARARYAGNVPAARGVQQQAAAPLSQATKDSLKIIISNLPTDVDEAAVKELFSKTCGPVRSCSLSYDSKGKSKGIADVVFQRRGDAQKAFDQYNNRMIDQKRPLKIEVVIDFSTAPLASRLAPAVPAAKPAAQPRAPAGAARGGAAKRGRGGKGGKRAGDRPAKTQEELDKEMTDYVNANATA
ncbi:hypothetical protein NliqN6_0791 [Naganishia liquefaciens]|uniref:RRM domain-containing protein n=1 Tax=Naganishia liquefaciens TaxID=104408 RepID=A0A8H3TP21_9TREE|nr:hypothetical protein NliqN6_0791 [Naganishia liquefaciens]